MRINQFLFPLKSSENFMLQAIPKLLVDIFSSTSLSYFRESYQSLICSANQVTGFYVQPTEDVKWCKAILVIDIKENY